MEMKLDIHGIHIHRQDREINFNLILAYVLKEHIECNQLLIN